MSTETNIACWVRVPASKQVTALHLTAEQEAAGLWCCHKQRCSAVFMTVELLPESCVCVTALTKEFAECRVAVNRALVAGLDTACFVKIKVKRGRRTVRKEALDARLLIKCLQEERIVDGKVKLAFDISSFSPLTFIFHIKTSVSECSMTERQPVPAAPDTACTALPPAECPVTTECQPVPAIKGRSKDIAKGPSKEAPKGASHDTPEEEPSEAQPWTLMPPPRLRSPDRRDILGQRWLSDDVMDLAQELLQRQFPNTRGLYASGAAFTLPPLQPGSGALFLQVVNRSTPMSLASMADYGRVGGSHWLLLSSYGAALPGQLAVYDSLYDRLSNSTATLVQQLQELHALPPGAVMRPVQRQRDGYSCGLFALAFAFSIAHGQDPCRVRYVRARMARHLLACLERGTVTPFPSEPKDTMG